MDTTRENQFPLFTWIENKTGTRLTRRGRLFFGWLTFFAFIALWAIGDYITTPEMCRVPVEEMTQGCKDLLFP